MVGNLITYDIGTDVFSVDGGPASPALGGRVRAVISPRPASAPAAAAPAQPAVQLRPSTGLGGTGK